MATGPLHTSVCGRPDASLSASWIAPGDMTLPFASIKPRLATKSVGSGVLERDVELHRGGTGAHARRDGDAQPIDGRSPALAGGSRHRARRDGASDDVHATTTRVPDVRM
jgi:hypothetical protein